MKTDDGNESPLATKDNWKVHFSKLPEICFPKFLRSQQFIPSKKASVLLEYLKTEKPSI